MWSLGTSIPPPAGLPPLQPPEPSTTEKRSAEVGGTITTSLLLASTGPGGVWSHFPAREGAGASRHTSTAQRPVSTWWCAGRSRGACRKEAAQPDPFSPTWNMPPSFKGKRARLLVPQNLHQTLGPGARWERRWSVGHRKQPLPLAGSALWFSALLRCAVVCLLSSRAPPPESAVCRFSP